MYERIISLENLFDAWVEFLKGKRKRKDVAEFSENLSENIYSLHLGLLNKTYRHSSYSAFNISDPKPRNIHKASVRDRLLHHAIHRIIYLYFDKKFISDSYSCRLNKGTHKAMERFESFSHKVSKNNTKQCWVLKCDIKKFFASIDHNLLRYIVIKYIPDENINWLLFQIIESFHTAPGKGLPLGNLTSQLLVNIYMNEFDQFVKHKLKAKHYIRYADDFVFFSQNKSELEVFIRYIVHFLQSELKLKLHPDKVFIKTLSSGVDFLGWVHFPDHRVLRTVAKRRMLKNISQKSTASYQGMLKWGNAYKLVKKINSGL
ncbi:MAG: group II intron reverse transcriptase domain-containing protein [Candidatus Zambryskibacteria bacterium]|nr:group II intron reverse transcriptase domain-containing protein [Candidatus Zambryskibacteria bacterium]